MENPNFGSTNQPENDRPPLPKRSSSNEEYISQGIEKLEDFVNDPANRDPEVKALHDKYNLAAIKEEHRSTPTNYLERAYLMPAIEPEKRNTPGYAGKVDPGKEVNLLDPNVPASELGVKLGETAARPIFDELSKEQGFDPEKRHTQ